MKCPKCSSQLAPLVHFPADGGPAQDVLGCMNCGWATMIDEDQLKLMQQGMKDPVEATLNDRQWSLILTFMNYMIEATGMTTRDAYAYLKTEIRKELAAIHVRSSHTPQPDVSSVSEGSNPTSDDSTNSAQLDLEQGS